VFTCLKKRITQLFPLLHFQNVNLPPGVDVVYLWGAFPKQKLKVPYIVEIDNPYVLTYYNQRAFRWYRWRIRSALQKAAQITFLSEAAYRHTLELVGSSIANKCTVFSPFMERNYEYNKRPEDGITRFLFVGLDWRRKGGPELLEAFSKLDQTDVRLTVISRVPESIITQYENDTRIIFMEPQSRETLLAEIYPTHDIFVLPSFHESLGVVLLEALSFGMGIITMDTYGAPEMVNAENGYVIPHPILQPSSFAGEMVVDCVSIEAKEFSDRYLLGKDSFPDVVEHLLLAFKKSVGNADEWQKASVALFEKKFSPEIWYKSLNGLIKNI